jgi:tight adherence protein B
VVLATVTIVVALVSGAPLFHVAAIAAALKLPAPLALAVVLALGGAVLRSPDHLSPDPEAVFLRAVGAELRAGASLRAAMVAAAQRASGLGLQRWARLAAAGHPMPELARRLGDQLPRLGVAVPAAVDLLARSGGAGAEVFEQLAAQVDQRRALEGEVAAATAQVRMSALVVAVAPVVVIGGLGARGTLLTLMESSVGLAIFVLGLVLQAVGLAVVVWLVRRAAP